MCFFCFQTLYCKQQKPSCIILYFNEFPDRRFARLHAWHHLTNPHWVRNSRLQNLIEYLKFHHAFMPQGEHDALQSLTGFCLQWLLSFCRRSVEGNFRRPTLLPRCRLTMLPSFLAAYLSCQNNSVYRDVVMAVRINYCNYDIPVSSLISCLLG